jgi:hypothetical protein
MLGPYGSSLHIGTLYRNSNTASVMYPIVLYCLSIVIATRVFQHEGMACLCLQPK